MQTILLSTEEKAKKEEGLRLIILSGIVEYTGRRDEYRVPHDTLRLLQEHEIPYELISER
jgi:hypothetical protein